MKKILVLFLCLTMVAMAGFWFWSRGDAHEESQETVAKRNAPGLYADWVEAKENYQLELNDEYEKRSKDSEETKKAFLKLHARYVEFSGRNLEEFKLSDLYAEALEFLALDPQDPFSITRAHTIIGAYGPTVQQRQEGLEIVGQAEAKMEEDTLSMQNCLCRKRSSISFWGLVVLI